MVPGLITYLALGGLAVLLLAWLLWPSKDQEKQDRVAIGQEVLEEALKKAKAQVVVPPEVERHFIARYWDRLSKLFKN